MLNLVSNGALGWSSISHDVITHESARGLPGGKQRLVARVMERSVRCAKLSESETLPGNKKVTDHN